MCAHSQTLSRTQLRLYEYDLSLSLSLSLSYSLTLRILHGEYTLAVTYYFEPKDMAVSVIPLFVLIGPHSEFVFNRNQTVSSKVVNSFGS